MKRIFIFSILLLLVLLVTGSSNKKFYAAPQLAGAWQRTVNGKTELLLFADGYCSHTVYNRNKRQFHYTKGGPFSALDGKLSIDYEFDSQEPQLVNTKAVLNYSLQGNVLFIFKNGGREQWLMLDSGKAALAGQWHITKRMQDGNLQSIHQTGTRKTVKLLSDTRFQWIAIDPGAKGFYGTGGGMYTFKNGVYTEHIDFFSRDSSRVGTSLSFGGKLENDGWHHSGKSSKGADIYEVWSRSQL